MNSLKPGFADELLKLALYDRLLALFRLSPWIILGMLLLVILFFLLNFNRLESGKRIQETDNAYTQLDRVVLEAKVNGYVAQVGFGDFQQVKAGDVLLRVQDADYRVRTDQARAVRDKSAANLERLDLEIGLQEACIRQARVAAENAAARLDLASRENARVQKLFKCNAVSTREADSAEINLRTAQHSHREALPKSGYRSASSNCKRRTGSCARLTSGPRKPSCRAPSSTWGTPSSPPRATDTPVPARYRWAIW